MFYIGRRRRIFEGKAKVLFEGPEPGTIVQYFKDDASAFNDQKRGRLTLIRDLLDRLPYTPVREDTLELEPLSGKPHKERYGVLKPLKPFGARG